VPVVRRVLVQVPVTGHGVVGSERRSSGWIVGKLEVRRSVLPIAVDRIQWNFEPTREAGRELF
jgi:hypothetical protein